MKILRITYIFLIFYSIQCNSTETIEDVDFIGKDNKTYKTAKDPGSKKIISEIVKTAPEFQSFKSDFSMKIQTFVPKPDTVYLDGKVFYSNEGKLVKIQLMDTFFGLIFTELISNPTQIQIKSSSSKDISNFPMGDLIIQDPNTKKNIAIPFPVIYQYLTGSYIDEIQNPKSKFLISESRVLLEKPDGIYEYFFQNGSMERLELSSVKRGLKAIALVKNSTSSFFPPKEIITKVISLDTEKENVLIQIQMKKTTKLEPGINTFRF
ncbi:MAG: hypothetical protein O9301_09925 [Leptospira sp.]|nr:hypothetical protein [Leptospira sp.]